MELLEKAKDYQLAINTAMKEYEKADNEYKELNDIKYSFIAMAGDKVIDLTAYKNAIEDFQNQIVSDMSDTRKCILESAKNRLAVLIGDTESVTIVEKEKPLKSENTGLKSDKPQLDTSYDNLYKLYITDNMGVSEIVKMHDTNSSAVYKALGAHGLVDLKKTKRQDAKFSGKQGKRP